MKSQNTAIVITSSSPHPPTGVEGGEGMDGGWIGRGGGRGGGKCVCVCVCGGGGGGLVKGSEIAGRLEFSDDITAAHPLSSSPPHPTPSTPSTPQSSSFVQC